MGTRTLKAQVDAAKNEIHVVSVKMGKDEMKETKKKDEKKCRFHEESLLQPATILAFCGFRSPHCKHKTLSKPCGWVLRRVSASRRSS
jgi:hypothetical protein